MTAYKITSIKHTEIIEGTLADAIERAQAIDGEYQPAYGVQIEGPEGETVWDSEDADEESPMTAKWGDWAGMEDGEQAKAICDWLESGQPIPDPVSADELRRDGCPFCGRSVDDHARDARAEALDKYARSTAADMSEDFSAAVRDEPQEVARAVGCTKDDVIDWCDAMETGE